jgi:hypothetical protein
MYNIYRWKAYDIGHVTCRREQWAVTPPNSVAAGSEVESRPSGQPDDDVVVADGGVDGRSVKVTCRGHLRGGCGGGGVWTGGTCATGPPLHGGCAGSVSAGVLANLRLEWLECGDLVCSLSYLQEKDLC